jgi:hypothetical protein
VSRDKWQITSVSFSIIACNSLLTWQGQENTNASMQYKKTYQTLSNILRTASDAKRYTSGPKRLLREKPKKKISKTATEEFTLTEVAKVGCWLRI